MTEETARTKRGIIQKILAAAGCDAATSLDPEKIAEAIQLYSTAREEPEKLVAEFLKARAAAEEQRRMRALAVQAADELKALLDRLTDAEVRFCSLEGIRTSGVTADTPAGEPRALCNVGGQLRELPIHPDVDPDDLTDLKPWEYVCVHAAEMIVVGVFRDDLLFVRAHGELVEFKGYFDRERGLVRVSRQGHEDEIVRLEASLLERELAPSSQLVLHRDDPRWAIDVVDSETSRSRFEIPIADIETRLEDLAGLDPVIQPLIEDILMRAIYPDISSRYDLRPLHGILLSSSKPGMGKTALMRAFAFWLHELGLEKDFEVVLYVVKPNELKIVWHGGDAKIVREELCAPIAARQALPRSRRLIQLVIVDEADSLGKRGGGDDGMATHSAAQNDAVQALLVEMDGMVQSPSNGLHPAHVIWAGLTNRPDLIDDAMKRPKRFGDLMLEMPDITRDGAESILEVYSRNSSIPWLSGGVAEKDISESEIRARFLSPAVTAVYDRVVLRYALESAPQKLVPLTAGSMLAGVNYMEAMNSAKKRAALRDLHRLGPAAVTPEDVTAGLLRQANSVAAQLAADRGMLRRSQRLHGRVLRVEPVSPDTLEGTRFLRSSA